MTTPAQASSLTAEFVAPERALRVLLMEDNENNRMLFEFFVGVSEHEFAYAADGEEGVRMHIERPFDLIFMDLEMPYMDGREAARTIRSWEDDTGTAPVTIIALSAHTPAEVERESREIGCDGFLTKPFSRKDLLAIISRLAD